jgi:hypothetical protein
VPTKSANGNLNLMVYWGFEATSKWKEGKAGEQMITVNPLDILQWVSTTLSFPIASGRECVPSRSHSVFVTSFVIRTTLAQHEFMLGRMGFGDCPHEPGWPDYVRVGRDSKTPTEIGAADTTISLAKILVTQGIEGDNMTIAIVDLQPRSRSLR